MSNGASRGRVRGRTRAALVLALLVALGAVLWVVSRATPPRSAPGRAAAAPEKGAAPAAGLDARPLEGARRSGLEDAEAAQEAASANGEQGRGDLAPLAIGTGGAAPPAEDPGRFEGRGALRGILQVPPGVDPPAGVTLELRPSRYVVGSEHAISRTVPLGNPEGEFEVRGLPFGGYDVGASAPGWNGRWQSLVLERGHPEDYLVVDLEPAGDVEGLLVDEHGNPLPGVGLRLEPVPEGEPRDLVSDAFGRYRFESVVDGTYRLFVGHPESPLVPVKILQVHAPRLSVPPIQIAGLLTLEVLVLDPSGEPVGGASVVGAGLAGGRVDGVTGPDGRLVVPNLPPGEYRLRATLEGVGTQRIRHVLEASRREGAEPAVIQLR